MTLLATRQAKPAFNLGPTRATTLLALLVLIGCGGGGGSGSEGTTASLKLSASPPGVAPGGTTTLTWSASNVTTCTAAGAWNGAKALSGTEMTPPINTDQTFQMTCTGPNGNVLSMTTVTVRTAALSWTPPSSNIDGSAATDLAGYKVYWGTASRNYTSSADVTGADSSNYTVTLTPGTWFFAVTALNASNEESAKSNEVSKTVF